MYFESAYIRQFKCLKDFKHFYLFDIYVKYNIYIYICTCISLLVFKNIVKY